MYGPTYPELITSAAAERIKRMELDETAHRARRARRACRARRLQQGLLGWTRLAHRSSSARHLPRSR